MILIRSYATVLDIHVMDPLNSEKVLLEESSLTIWRHILVINESGHNALILISNILLGSLAK